MSNTLSRICKTLNQVREHGLEPDKIAISNNIIRKLKSELELVVKPIPHKAQTILGFEFYTIYEDDIILIQPKLGEH